MHYNNKHEHAPAQGAQTNPIRFRNFVPGGWVAQKQLKRTKHFVGARLILSWLMERASRREFDELEPWADLHSDYWHDYYLVLDPETVGWMEQLTEPLVVEGV
jgi:hypothetical protein